MDMLNEMEDIASGFNYHGLSVDPQFEAALTEGELNGRRIYDYSDDRVDVDRLNDWLEENGKKPLRWLPDDMVGFETWGWFCDEDNTVYPLCREGADTGRRQVNGISADYAKEIIYNASSFLMNQVQEDGKFIYGLRPQFDKEIDDYNILRHTGTIWSLICRYRIFPDETLKKMIDDTIEYMLSQILYDEDGAGYIYEEDSDEIKLGGNGIAILALTEYMDLFENDDFREVCEALGEGILKQQDPEDGSYWHILWRDFSKLEEFRTIYYDGECTFGLTRLYSLTGDQKWLDAACKAIDHFIAEDYTQYRDHWVAYSLNEVTKYLDRQDYYDFALANATNNYKRIMGRSRTYPTNLELLISAFETWQRMVDKGIDTGDFDVKELLNVISARANRQLSGYFYPDVHGQSPAHPPFLHDAGRPVPRAHRRCAAQYRRFLPLLEELRRHDGRRIGFQLRRLHNVRRLIHLFPKRLPNGSSPGRQTHNLLRPPRFAGEGFLRGFDGNPGDGRLHGHGHVTVMRPGTGAAAGSGRPKMSLLYSANFR